MLEKPEITEYKKKMYHQEPDQKNKLHYDKVTMDAPRDFFGEAEAQRNRTVVYDEAATKRAKEIEEMPLTHTTGFTELDFVR